MFTLIIKIVQTSGAQIYAALLGIITLSITARWLGPEGRGIIAYITTWAVVFIEIGTLTLTSVLIYRATQDCDEAWLGRMLGTLAGYIVLASGVIWLIIIIYYFGERYAGFHPFFRDLPPLALILGFLLLPIGIAEHYARSLLTIEDKLNIYNRFQIIGSTTNVFIVIILVAGLGLNIYGVLIGRLVWDLFLALGPSGYLYKKAKGSISFCKKELKSLVIDGSKIHLNTIGALLVLHVDIIMIGTYLGEKETGLYQLAVQTSQMMMMLPYAAATVLQGEVTRRGIHDVWSYQKKILGLTLLAMIAASIIFGFTAEWWMLLLAGDEFAPSVTLFQYLLIALLFATVSAIINVQWVARGLFWQLSAISLFKGGANIVLNMILLPKYGLMGAVWATLAVFAISFIADIAMFIYCETDARRHKSSE